MRFLSILSMAGLIVTGSTSKTEACPFCSAVSQTFSEEIVSMDAVIIAKLVKLPERAEDNDTEEFVDEVPKATFEIVQTLKGQSLITGIKTIETVYFGNAKLNERFLLMGVDPPKLNWSTPLRITDRTIKYLGQLEKLPKKGAERLVFFQNHLEDEDDLLARDAYDEFAKAPYEAVKALKPHMKRDQLVAWINDPNVPASRRRLYLVMLSVCGGEQDLQMLEEMLQSSDRKKKAGLDAMISCYLTLRGPAGMPLVEELFLKNKKAEYADTYAAIMAVRFHGSQADIIPRKRLLQGLRYMLERPQLADLVIPDLARWKDWSQVEKLVVLFKDADEKTSWVRVPVINYLKACPLPKAKEYIKELEKIDPAAVKRANTFFPFGGGSEDTASESDEQPDDSGEATSDSVKELKPKSALNALPVRKGEQVAIATSRTIEKQKKQPMIAAPSNYKPALGVALIAGVVILYSQWRILCGAGRVDRYTRRY